MLQGNNVAGNSLIEHSDNEDSENKSGLFDVGQPSLNNTGNSERGLFDVGQPSSNNLDDPVIYNYNFNSNPGNEQTGEDGATDDENNQYDPALDEDDTQSIPGEPFYAGQQEAMIAGEFDYLEDMEIDDG
jgi:hypothetical protein